jgi:lipopolysaccharide transport system ATP-binding protein
MSALLTLENVGMQFAVRPDHESGQHTVFEGINLTLNEGDRLGIVGRNGAGKSTLLRIMAKIYAPATGSVIWAPGVTVSLLSLGLGFKNELTGRDNAYLAGLLQGLTKNAAKQCLVSIEAFCELGDYFDEPVKTYSAGMRARLGFATALLNNASVLLIDEVLSVGDKEFREKAQLALEDQFSDRRSVVLVSHSEAHVAGICNGAICLDRGGITARGAPQEVLRSHTGQPSGASGSKINR